MRCFGLVVALLRCVYFTLCVWCFWVVSDEFGVSFLGFCFTCLCFSGWPTMGVFVLFVLDDAPCVVNSVG